MLGREVRKTKIFRGRVRRRRVGEVREKKLFRWRRRRTG